VRVKNLRDALAAVGLFGKMVAPLMPEVPRSNVTAEGFVLPPISRRFESRCGYSSAIKVIAVQVSLTIYFSLDACIFRLYASSWQTSGNVEEKWRVAQFYMTAQQ